MESEIFSGLQEKKRFACGDDPENVWTPCSLGSRRQSRFRIHLNREAISTLKIIYTSGQAAYSQAPWPMRVFVYKCSTVYNTPIVHHDTKSMYANHSTYAGTPYAYYVVTPTPPDSHLTHEHPPSRPASPSFPASSLPSCSSSSSLRAWPSSCSSRIRTSAASTR